MNGSDRLGQFLERDWRSSLEEEPELATQVGIPDCDDRWSDWSPAGVEQRQSRKRNALTELKTIPTDELSGRERVSHDLLSLLHSQAVEGERFPEQLLPIDNLRSVVETVPRILGMMPAASAADCERIIARIHAVPRLIDQTIGLLNVGIERGVTQSRPAVTQVPGQIQQLMKAGVAGSPLMAPLRACSDSLSGPTREKLSASAEDAVRNSALPAYERLEQYLTETYIPRTRTTTDWASLPDGEAWYAWKARVSTTTTHTPGALHQLGLVEVARVREQMTELASEAGFSGDVAAFRHFLQSEPRFFFPDAESLLTGYRDICKRIESGLARLFGRLPWLPYGVAAVPEHSQRSAPVGYYESASLQGRRPGWFYANTYDLRSRPKWEMEALTLHEAVPGHHLQIALALEMDDLPEFRKWSFLEAYVEGWALYAESLGKELGLYRDPFSRMGQLSYDAVRSCRLVLDTGLHHLSLGRDWAIEYLLANSCETLRNVEVEIDRYIGMPAQALSYKAGELVLRGLRHQATVKLGDQFDLPAFHDVVLSEGPLPLDMLETQVRLWMERANGAGV